MSIESGTARAELIAAVDAIATARQDGALLVLDAESTSMRRLRQAGASDESVAEIVRSAAEIAVHTLTSAPWARTGWSRHEFAVSERAKPSFYSHRPSSRASSRIP